MKIFGGVSKIFASFVGAISLTVIANPASAISYEVLPDGVSIRIKGTGYNLTNPLPANDGVNSTGIDPNWTIKSFANNAVGPNLFIPNTTPGAWYDGVAGDTNTANAAISFAGDPNTYRWATYANYPNALGVTLDSGEPRAQSFFGPQAGRSTLIPGPPYSNYTYIVSTTFTLAQSGLYDFSYNTTADNRVQIYIGGCVTGAGTQTPGITTACPDGGIFVNQNAANTGGQFRNLLSGTGRYSLAAGTYDLNYVVTDNFSSGSNTYGQTGILIGSSAFTRVPAPLPIVGAGVFFSYSRKIRRRIHTTTA